MAAEEVEKLAVRIRGSLPKGFATERRMFGGVVFLMNGNMFCGATKNGLLVRVGKEANEKALTKPHARPFMETGKPIAGYVTVDAQGIENKASLNLWLKMAQKYVATLPAK